MTDFAEAVAAHRRGDVAAAEAGYRSALSSDQAPAALCNLGAILRSRGEIAEAETLYRRAIEHAPGRTPARMNLGQLLWGAGRLSEAVLAYRELLALKPDHD